MNPGCCPRGVCKAPNLTVTTGHTRKQKSTINTKNDSKKMGKKIGAALLPLSFSPSIQTAPWKWVVFVLSDSLLLLAKLFGFSLVFCPPPVVSNSLFYVFPCRRRAGIPPTGTLWQCKQAQRVWRRDTMLSLLMDKHYNCIMAQPWIVI